MQSPVYPDIALQPKELEAGLAVFQCPKSGGMWIPLANFLAWKETHALQTEPANTASPAVQPDDSHRGALVCPESGRLLIRYKVGQGLKFQVDMSPITGGIWLDQGEWEAMKYKGLHTEINFFSTSGYQFKIRAAEYEEKLEQTFRNRVGNEDYAKVESFKQWLVNQPQKREICAYLLHHSEPKKAEVPVDDKAPRRHTGSF